MAEALRRHLGAARVIEARGYGEALGYLEQERLDLVVMDPAKDGSREATRQLRHIRRLQPALKLVVHTAPSGRRDILAALEAGVHGYVLKDGDLGGFIACLKRVLAGEVYVPPLLCEISGEDGVAAAGAPSAGEADGAMGRRSEYRLSARQLEVLEHLVEGRSNKQIARALNLAESTIKMHVGAVFRVLGVNNRAKAAAIGQRLLDARRRDSG